MKDRGSELDSQYFADGLPALVNHKAEYDVEAIAHALTNIYRRNVDVDHDIEPHLYDETQRIMDEAIAEGYANAAEKNVPTPDEAFRNAFSHSADVFSAFRVHKMQTDIAAQMLDSDGHLKPFSKFVKDVSPYIEHRNRAWLQTEYDTAIIRAQNAAEWQQFQTEKDVFPNLEWIPSTSPHPGADHQIFWGTVLPVDDPFWSEHKPGDRWNCKCELRQTDRDSTPVPSSDGKSDPMPGLESNPATDREPFSDRHPYYPSGCSSCPFAGNRLAALVHDLAGRGKHCNDCVKVDKVIKGTSDKQPDNQTPKWSDFAKNRNYKPVEKNIYAPVGKSSEKDYADKLAVARQAVGCGYRVWLLGKTKLTNGRNPDYLFEKNNIYHVYDLKRIYSAKSIEQELIGSIGQSDRIVLKIADSKASPRTIISAIKKYYEADKDVKEVMIFRGKRKISIERNFFYEKNYYQRFFQNWQ